MVKLPPVPLERPAASKRSPNRRPRHRDLTRRAGVARLKAAFLGSLEEGLSPVEIARRMKLTEGTVAGWRHDARFKAAMEAIRAERAEIIESFRVPSVDDLLYKKALEGEVKAALPYLEAHWPEVYGKKRIEHSGGLSLEVKDIILEDND